MRVGVNYPWLHCGWDFGAPPAGYPARAGDAALIAADFARLRAAGASIVRWFVLADGFTCGVGPEAPLRAGRTFRFTPPERLPQALLEDFEALLSLCARAGLQLLPVLLDFHWGFPGLDCHTRDARTLALWDRAPPATPRALRLHAARARAARLPPGYVKGGRMDVLRDDALSARFLEVVLAPLLAVSQRERRAIYAWELINEPEWIVRPALLPRRLDRDRIEAASMRRFLRRGLSMIAEHGFLATVGFARARTLLRWDTPREPLGLGLNQLHYYPQSRRARLPAARFGNGLPCLLGEFASQSGWPRAWPELPPAQQDIAARFALAERRGYAAALLWSYRAGDRASHPEQAALEAQLARFTAAEAGAR